jgi:hypothetical protein
MEDVMQTLATKLTISAAIAALICATPVSIDLVRPGAAGSDGTAHLALALDTAQAQPARSGHEAGARGGDRRNGSGDRAADARGREFKGNDVRSNNIKGNDVRANNIKANDVRANDVKANDVRANDIRANDVRANDVRANDVRANDVRRNNVNVNDVNATKVDATYVRPPYVARPATVAATATAVGTTVAVLPASCTVVDYKGVTYHHCGDNYYVASNGAYVVVNPPR